MLALGGICILVVLGLCGFAVWSALKGKKEPDAGEAEE